MALLAQILQDHREELLDRIMAGAGRAGFLGAVSNARFDWAEMAGHMERALCATEEILAARQGLGEKLLEVADPAHMPAEMMGRMAARQIRPRGIGLNLLISLTMVCRDALVDLLRAHAAPQDFEELRDRQARHFDRMMLGLCHEWTEGEGVGETARELAQAARVQAETKTKFIGILESLGSPVFLLRSDGAVEYCNPAAWMLFGKDTSRGTLQNRTIVELVPEVAVALGALEQSGGDEATVERRLETRQGTRYMDVRMNSIRDARRQKTGSVVVLNDVTLRRSVEERLRSAREELEARVHERTEELEQANELLRGEVRERLAAEVVLRESEARYRSLVDLSPDGIIVHSDGMVVFANSAALKLVGAPPGYSLEGQRVVDYVHPDDREKVNARIRRMIQSGLQEPTIGERFLKLDGSSFEVEVSASGVVYQGKPSVQVVFRDISDRVREEREAEERRKVVEILLAAQGRISRLEPEDTGPLLVDSMARSCGADRAEWFALDPQDGSLRMTASVGLPPEIEEKVRGFVYRPGEGEGFMSAVAESREPVYLNDCRTDPRWRALEGLTRSAFFVPVRFGEHLFGVALLMSDVLEGFPASRRAMATLSSDYLAAALESAHLNAQTRAAESRYRSIFENAVEGIYQCLPDGRIVAANPALARILGYPSPSEVLRDSRDFLARMHADPARREAFLRELSEQDEVRGFEYEAHRIDGQRVWVSESALALRDDAGKLVRWEGVVEDVSRRKELESQLQHAQKMEAVGRLAGGVAHDFNNLLTAILGYSGLLLDRLDPGDEAWRDVQEIREAGKRASALTGQLLAFSRKQVLQPRVLDLNEVVTATEKLLRRLIGEDIELFTRLSDVPVRVKVDPGQMDQILINLAVNSRDAMPNGGRLSIEVSTLDIEDPGHAAKIGMPPGRYAMVAVVDTGVGMDLATQSHLFEPFFTTKGPGKGTGLGLAVVYGIVKQSGGHIWFYSEPGIGTTMKVCLPRIEDDHAEESRRRPEMVMVRGSETVLVAEDEAAVRGLVRVVLEGAGYQVLEAQDGKRAIEVAARFPGPVHLLVTDVIMPGMNGRDLSRALRASRPAIRVLFTSGYTDSVIVQSGLLSPYTSFLQKPFSPATLLEVVRDLLDRPVEETEPGD